MTSFAERLSSLVTLARRPDGSVWTVTQIIQALKARQVRISAEMLYKLLSGERTNPTHDLIEALCQIFGVTSTYFSASVVESQPYATLLDDPNVLQILHWLLQYPPEARLIIMQGIDFLLHTSQQLRSLTQEVDRVR